MSKYLVTGGAGFIGSNLVKYLLSRGDEVVAIDELSTGSLDNLIDVKNKVEFIKIGSGDCLHLSQAKGLSGIFHLGMPSSSPLYKNNHSLVGSALNDFIAMLELAKRENCKIVFASTSSVYNGNPVPFKEDMAIFPKDFYSEARYYMERMAQLYFDLWGVKSIGLRFLSVYGPGEESKKKLANMVSQIFWWMNNNKQPVLYGNGEQTRDFVYVKDAVLALCLSMSSKVGQDIFNVGTGKSYSFNQVVKIINNILGKNIEPIYLANPVKNYVDLHLGDPKKAKDVLGFQTQYSLEQGIQELFLHQQEQSHD
ncbi:MAG: GDP-mannose 4,6-dehydratase [Candidatus Pacebacteria bacterium]|nr:GDP-mannose 4,6-dehydratase [Candidatus Paceibacterota bacterium]